MDVNELKAFENLVSLTESQAKTINSLQSLEKLRLTFNPDNENREHEEIYPAIMHPDTIWSAQGYSIYEGIHLITVLFRVDQVEIDEDYLKALQEEANVKYSRFDDGKTDIQTLVLFKPWDAKVILPNSQVIRRRQASKGSRLYGHHKCVKRDERGRRFCSIEYFNEACTSDRLCTQTFEEQCSESWIWPRCVNFRVNCVNCLIL